MKTKGNLQIPDNYNTTQTIRETEIAIKMIKDNLERELADTLNLTRVSAPLFVDPSTGLNDNLNGIERPVTFDIKEIGMDVEIVQSLAKWKRMALGEYSFRVGEGLYTDMNAIRRDEVADNLHSIYVDQWDWERIIEPEDRNVDFLKKIVNDIFHCLRRTQNYLLRFYPDLDSKLPEEIFFITTQELEDMYPAMTPRQREDAICREKKAVFVMQIGGLMQSGIKHDGRAPDYDDWSLNGDIILWYPLLERAFEISSMGIRVDSKSMQAQLDKANCMERGNLPFHRCVIENTIPLSIGGGIGQSRMCMYFLNKAHIGEVQSSVWPKEMIRECREHGIALL
ncbi:MAG: aspartate--ammonia ligase [Saccharofermentanales bacterium]